MLCEPTISLQTTLASLLADKLRSDTGHFVLVRELGSRVDGAWLAAVIKELLSQLEPGSLDLKLGLLADCAHQQSALEESLPGVRVTSRLDEVSQLRNTDGSYRVVFGDASQAVEATTARAHTVIQAGVLATAWAQRAEAWAGIHGLSPVTTALLLSVIERFAAAFPSRLDLEIRAAVDAKAVDDNELNRALKTEVVSRLEAFRHSSAVDKLSASDGMGSLRREVRDRLRRNQELAQELMDASPGDEKWGVLERWAEADPAQLADNQASARVKTAAEVLVALNEQDPIAAGLLSHEYSVVDAITSRRPTLQRRGGGGGGGGGRGGGTSVRTLSVKELLASAPDRSTEVLNALRTAAESALEVATGEGAKFDLRVKLVADLGPEERLFEEVRRAAEVDRGWPGKVFISKGIDPQSAVQFLGEIQPVLDESSAVAGPACEQLLARRAALVNSTKFAVHAGSLWWVLLLEPGLRAAVEAYVSSANHVLRLCAQTYQATRDDRLTYFGLWETVESLEDSNRRTLTPLHPSFLESQLQLSRFVESVLAAGDADSCGRLAERIAWIERNHCYLPIFPVPRHSAPAEASAPLYWQGGRRYAGSGIPSESELDDAGPLVTLLDSYSRLSSFASDGVSLGVVEPPGEGFVQDLVTRALPEKRKTGACYRLSVIAPNPLRWRQVLLSSGHPSAHSVRVDGGGQVTDESVDGLVNSIKELPPCHVVSWFLPTRGQWAGVVTTSHAGGRTYPTLNFKRAFMGKPTLVEKSFQQGHTVESSGYLYTLCEEPSSTPVQSRALPAAHLTELLRLADWVVIGARAHSDEVLISPDELAAQTGATYLGQLELADQTSLHAFTRDTVLIDELLGHADEVLVNPSGKSPVCALRADLSGLFIKIARSLSPERHHRSEKSAEIRSALGKVRELRALKRAVRFLKSLLPTDRYHVVELDLDDSNLTSWLRLPEDTEQGRRRSDRVLIGLPLKGGLSPVLFNVEVKGGYDASGSEQQQVEMEEKALRQLGRVARVLTELLQPTSVPARGAVPLVELLRSAFLTQVAVALEAWAIRPENEARAEMAISAYTQICEGGEGVAWSVGSVLFNHRPRETLSAIDPLTPVSGWRTTRIRWAGDAETSLTKVPLGSLVGALPGMDATGLARSLVPEPARVHEGHSEEASADAAGVDQLAPPAEADSVSDTLRPQAATRPAQERGSARETTGSAPSADAQGVPSRPDQAPQPQGASEPEPEQGAARRPLPTLESGPTVGTVPERTQDLEAETSPAPEFAAKTDSPRAPSLPRFTAIEPSAAAQQKYRAVLSTLTGQGVGVYRVSEEAILEGPGFYVFRMHLERGERPQTVFKYAEDLKYALQLPANRAVRVYTDRGHVVVEVPKRAEERTYVDARDLWELDHARPEGLYVDLGVDVRGAPVGVHFSSSRCPHLLIGGMTGGGKSVALNTILRGLLRAYSADEIRLHLIDPKGNEFVQLEVEEQVEAPIGMDSEDAIQVLNEQVEEMNRRYKAMKQLSRRLKKRVSDIMDYNAMSDPSDRWPWHLVVLDEFSDLTSDKDDKKQIEALLKRLAQKARACGIHCIVATQKPSAEVISTTIRSNLGAQLALAVRSGTDSKIIMDATGAEALAGNGDAFLRLSGEEPIRLQCAWVPEEEG